MIVSQVKISINTVQYAIINVYFKIRTVKEKVQGEKVVYEKQSF